MAHCVSPCAVVNKTVPVKADCARMTTYSIFSMNQMPKIEMYYHITLIGIAMLAYNVAKITHSITEATGYNLTNLVNKIDLRSC